MKGEENIETGTNRRKGVFPAWWKQDVDRILADLEADVREEERRRYHGLDPCRLSMREIGAALYVSDKLREAGVLEVTPELMRRLIDEVLEAGLGYGG